MQVELGVAASERVIHQIFRALINDGRLPHVVVSFGE